LNEMKKINVSKAEAVKVLRQKVIKQTAQQVSSNSELEVKRSHSRKRTAPPNLKWLIDKVNSLPREMKTLGDLKAQVRAAPYDFPDVDLLILAEVEKLPSNLKEFVGTFSDKKLTRPFSQKELAEMESWPSVVRDSLRSSWTTLQKDDEGRRVMRLRYDFLTQGQIALDAIARGDTSAGPFFPEIWLYKDQNGEVDVATYPVPLLECLQGEEWDRICKCPICEKIYWAERIDQPTCSPRCNNIRRSRIQRGTYLETRLRFQQKTKNKARRKKQHGP
jgi:hypothetical protein